VALVFVDLNGFKAINDHYGHAAGDRVLITTATRLKRILRHRHRRADWRRRIRGDPARPRPDLDLQDEARSICQKIFIELSPPITIGNDQRHIGTSLGVAVFPDHAPTMDRLLHIADLAMYEAKRSGNNQYRLGGEPARVHAQGF
jgi:diguanylate cyclase (GGDEF)-like protein